MGIAIENPARLLELPRTAHRRLVSVVFHFITFSIWEKRHELEINYRQRSFCCWPRSAMWGTLRRKGYFRGRFFYHAWVFLGPVAPDLEIHINVLHPLFRRHDCVDMHSKRRAFGVFNPYFPDKVGCREKNIYNRNRDFQRRI